MKKEDRELDILTIALKSVEKRLERNEYLIDELIERDFERCQREKLVRKMIEKS